MSDSARTSLQWRPVLVAILVAAVLYPLSIGPAFWLCYQTGSGAFPPDWAFGMVVAFYFPVIAACGLSETSMTALNSYVHWWLPPWGGPFHFH